MWHKLDDGDAMETCEVFTELVCFVDFATDDGIKIEEMACLSGFKKDQETPFGKVVAIRPTDRLEWFYCLGSLREGWLTVFPHGPFRSAEEALNAARQSDRASSKIIRGLEAVEAVIDAMARPASFDKPKVH